ncbi:MAG: DNA topoisomerase 3 [Myxococcota bacterium]
MTRLLIAEKPSVARDIARVLGVQRKHNGFLEGSGWLITWCIGHLVELMEPHEYFPEWKRWSLQSLPMLPDQFKLRPVKQTEDQFRTVERLLMRADVDTVVNACDAGREGELIFRYVYTLAGCRKPIQRLWISSMTDQAIEEGIRQLRDAREYDRLFAAARCRSEADWLVGLNATRAITVRSRSSGPGGRESTLFSVGRVQTPTLAMLVDREKEIRNFVPKHYWQLVATFQNEKGTWTGRWFKLHKEGHETITLDRFDAEAEAQAVRAKVLGRTGRITELEQKRTKEPPPMLFDLTRLQRTANKRYGFSAARTLELAQALYERHKLLTYPRTDSTHLSTDMVKGLPGVVGALKVGPYLPFAEHLLALEKLPISKRFVDDKKVSDHHAIIPTPHRPRLEALLDDERKLYDLVVRRFLGIFFPDAIFDRTRVVTTVEAETFVTRGKVQVDPGWREVAGFKEDESKKRAKQREKDDEDNPDDDDDDQGVLPPLKKNDPAEAHEVELLTRQTQPPPRYTEASLLAAMETAGKRIEAEELQQAMKDSGLGTPATRASIIETLLHREYIYRKGKTLIPSEKGMLLIAAIPVESLRSPQLTGEWEARMARMARGEYEHSTFMQEVVAYVREVIGRIKSAPPIDLSALKLGNHAPDTQESGDEQDTDRAGETSERQAPSASKSALANKTGKKTQTRERQKATASAATASSARDAMSAKASRTPKSAADDGNSQDENTLDAGRCPRCQQPVEERPDAWSCSQGPRCGFRLKKEVAGKTLSSHMVKQLLEKGRTRVLKGFVSPRSGVKFSAALLLKPDGGIGFEFQERPGDSASHPSGPSEGSGRKSNSANGNTPEPAPARATAKRPTPSSAGHHPPDEERMSAGMAPSSQTTRPATYDRSQSAEPIRLAPATVLSGELAQAASASKASEPELALVDTSKKAPPRSSNTGTRALSPAAPVESSGEHPIEQITSPMGIQLGTCPLCRVGQVITGKKAWGCARWREGCSFMIPFTLYGRELTEGEARRLLAQGRLGPLRGLRDQDHHLLDGTIILQLDRSAGRAQLILEERS